MKVSEIFESEEKEYFGISCWINPYSATNKEFFLVGPYESSSEARAAVNRRLTNGQPRGFTNWAKGTVKVVDTRAKAIAALAKLKLKSPTALTNTDSDVYIGNPSMWRISALIESVIAESVKGTRVIANKITRAAADLHSLNKKSITNFLNGQGAKAVTHSSKNWQFDGSLGDYQSGTFELNGATYYYAFSNEFGMPVTVSDKPLKQDEGSISEAIDNGPRGRIKTDNIKYGQTRNMTGGTASKSELAKRRTEIKAAETAQKNARKEYEKMLKQRVDAKFAPKKKVDLDVVARKIEEVLGNTFPDSDPIDWLAPWFKKTYGMEGLEIGETLNKAVKKLGRYKDYYDYLAQTWDEYSADFPGLEGRGNPWK